jgi:O-6-methylguanine DNA methyltransferase
MAPPHACGRLTIDTPIGDMVAVLDDTHVHFLEFADRPGLASRIARYLAGRELDDGAAGGPLAHRVRGAVRGYFAGDALRMDLPLAPAGTDFQRRVWNGLSRIPPGSAIAYAELAARVGAPRAVRAVGSANRLNRCAIAIPCHRVIAASGELSGYAGGVERKRWLLAHEGWRRDD